MFKTGDDNLSLLMMVSQWANQSLWIAGRGWRWKPRTPGGLRRVPGVSRGKL